MEESGSMESGSFFADKIVKVWKTEYNRYVKCGYGYDNLSDRKMEVSDYERMHEY